MFHLIRLFWLISKDEPDSLAHHLDKHISKLSLPAPSKESTKLDYISPAGIPPPSTASPDITQPPSLYSSSLISQSDDPEDQTVLVLPDWKVVHDIENSKEGVKGLWDGVLSNKLGRAGRTLTDEGGIERRRSWVLPYRAVVLLCEPVTPVDLERTNT